MDILNNLPLVTDFPTRKQWEAAIWEILLTRLTALKSEHEFRRVIQYLIGTYEQKTITNRALIASRLNSRISYREIGSELWVSPQTISAAKKSLIEKKFRSSRSRGHKPRVYSTNLKKKYYRKTKYGPVNKYGFPVINP